MFEYPLLIRCLQSTLFCVFDNCVQLQIKLLCNPLLPLPQAGKFRFNRQICEKIKVTPKGTDNFLLTFNFLFKSTKNLKNLCN